MIRKQFIPLLAFSSVFLASCLQENLSTDINRNGEVELSISPMLDGAVSRTDAAGSSTSPYGGTSMSVTLWYQYDNLNEQYNKKFVKFTKNGENWQSENNQKLFLKNDDGTDKTKFSVYVTAPAVDDPDNNLEEVKDNDTYVGKVLANQKFEIKTDQSDKLDFIASDLASYNGEKLNPNDYPDGKINISLTHRLSLLKIKVTEEEADGTNGQSTGEISDVKVKSKTKVIFSTKSKSEGQLKIDDTDTEKDITAHESGDEYHVILPPQEISGKEFIKLEIGGQSYTYTVPASVTHKLETQKSYTLTLVKGKTDMKLGGVTVEDWEAKEISLVTVRSGKWSDEAKDCPKDGDVYKATNGGQLHYALTNVAAGETVRLMNDIDLSKHYWSLDFNKAGSSSSLVTIDGNGKTINGLCIDANQTTSTDLGFIGGSTNNKWVLIKDLNFQNPEIVCNSSTTRAGVVLAKGTAGCGVFNCRVNGAEIEGNDASNCEVGGIAGDLSNGSAIVGSIFEGTVTGNFKGFGGLSGFAGKSMLVANIVNCNFTDVTVGTSGKGLYVARSGRIDSAPITVTGCYYAGNYTVDDIKYVNSDEYPDDNQSVASSLKSKLTADKLDDTNTAINSGNGYEGTNGASGTVKATCILLSLKDDYKYNFKENNGSDKETYPYIVTNVVASN